MPFSFFEFLSRRDLNEMEDLGIDLSDKKTKDAFIAQLQQQKVDLKQAAANVKANPALKPDKAQLDADQKLKLQQDMQAGKAVPTGVKKNDWEKAVGLMTPTGNAVPNEIGRGKPALDVPKVLNTGVQQGALPANVGKVKPSWLGWKPDKPPASTTTPTVDQKNKMTPADLAKAKTQPTTEA
jgi:hypothetical protein